MNSLYVWLAVFVLAIGIEIATAGLATVWFAGGAFVAFVLAVLKVDLIWQVVAFVAVSFGLLAFTRPAAKRYLSRFAEKTNVQERIIGRKALVTEEINNILASGKIVIDSMPWTARSLEEELIPVGRQVTVEKLIGNKCIVSPADDMESEKEAESESNHKGEV
ncbi:MAG: NfeD family protein [Lachnospiraceae bacterium]|nr:NfeD family protein [Lachnospiraceae bacterium]